MLNELARRRAVLARVHVPPLYSELFVPDMSALL